MFSDPHSKAMAEMSVQQKRVCEYFNIIKKEEPGGLAKYVSESLLSFKDGCRDGYMDTLNGPALLQASKIHSYSFIMIYFIVILKRQIK